MAIKHDSWPKVGGQAARRLRPTVRRWRWTILWLVTDWPTTKPWQYTFSASGDSKTLSTTDASVEFMNSVADASKVEIKYDNGALLTTVDMKDSAAAIRAIVNCVNEHPPSSPTPP